MIDGFKMVFIRRKTLILAAACLCGCLGLIIASMNYISEKNQRIELQRKPGYVILAANDSGMHCYQSDYSSFLILPPGNTLRMQVFLNQGNSAQLINSGICVSYRMIDNTTSADKINFWQYAQDYGYNASPNIGITGNGLSGSMKLSADGKYYEATAIPVTPFNDGSMNLNPYQLVLITVTDRKTGKKLAETGDVVVPVSNEMDCSICHGTANTGLNILKTHDRLSGTHLAADLARGTRYKCSGCHQDNILSAPGKPGIMPLSEAIHGFHDNKMSRSDVIPVCYSCHPGPVTQCYRGAMKAAGVSCVNPKCHGDMANIAKTQAEGRQAWLQQPDCRICHGAQFGVNTGRLYRNSYLVNNSNPQMNGFILCESCHNSPHAEWVSTQRKDNLLPLELLGYPSFIDKCTVCHQGTGVVHSQAAQ